MRALVAVLVALLCAAILVVVARRRALADVRHGVGASGTADTLYPYVVPASYLPASDSTSRELARPLGHELYVMLVFDLHGAVRNAIAKDLARLGLTAEKAHERALQNLEKLLQDEKIQMAVFHGPMGKPFVLVGGSWAAATSLLVPGLRDLVAERLATKEICASIPHREALLLFAKGDRAYRDQMRALVREKESDGTKPLTFGLFELTDAGVKPLDEP